MHGLIPRAVDEALQERGIEPVDTPNIKDVALEEGQPLKFTAADRNRAAVRSRRSVDASRRRAAPTVVTDEAVDKTLQRLRERAREVRAGRRPRRRRRRHGGRSTSSAQDAGRRARSPRERQPRARLAGEPAGLRRQLIGLERRRREDLHDPLPRGLRRQGDGRTPTSTYTVTVKDIRRKVLPELDDEFAKDLGEFESLGALRDRVRADLQAGSARSTRASICAPTC